MQARVLTATPLAARGLIRLEVQPVARPDLPARVRVNAVPDQLEEAVVSARYLAGSRASPTGASAGMRVSIFMV